MVRLLTFALAILLASTARGTRADDLSSDTLAIVHDLMAPYREGAAPVDADVDPTAVKQALDILSRENLVKFPRPQARALGAAPKLYRALALGNRGTQFVAEVGAVRDAIIKQNEMGAKAAIQSLYVKMGRSRPEGASLEPLYKAARDAVGSEPEKTESTSLRKPGYSILIENARAAGKARIAVRMDKGPEGKPARVEFKGDISSVPSSEGDDLATKVTPSVLPETMTSVQAAALRKRVNGRWMDQEGVSYEITGDGDEIVITQIRADARPRTYRGAYDLGYIEARFEVASADDLSSSLPLKVRQQLAGIGLHFDIAVAAVDHGAKLDGTWSSQHVTYSPEGAVKRTHDPYSLELVLTRDHPKIDGETSEVGIEARSGVRLRFVDRIAGYERPIGPRMTFFGGPVALIVEVEKPRKDDAIDIKLNWVGDPAARTLSVKAFRSKTNPLYYSSEEFFIYPPGTDEMPRP